MNDLIEAVKANDVEKVKQLIKAGADINDVGDYDENRLINGFTPLQWAVWKGHIEIVKLLIQAGADINSQSTDDIDGHTALHCASDLPIVKLLIQAGADVSIKDLHGETALQWASFQGRTKIVEFLIKHKSKLTN
jgi:ankyrin repeat protein